MTEAPRPIHVARGVIAAMIAHARRDTPRECCGLLVGDASRIERSVPAENLAPGCSRYLVNPADHILVNKELRGTPHAVVGVYHSHPHGPAEPSPTDVAEAYYPEFLHVIVSLEEEGRPVVEGYRIASGSVTAVALVEDPRE